MKPRQCDDNNPKTVKRKYDWDGKYIEILLCEKHCQDPDFANPIMEEKL